MAIDTNNAIDTRTTSGTRSTTDAQKGLNANYQDFLQLLTTQLKNQDPTSPADTNQLTAQIAMLSQVEQQINTNSNLEKLVSLFMANQSNAALSYIGKAIDATGNQSELRNGMAQFVYNLPPGSTAATVTITDSAGKTVFTGGGTNDAGRNQVLWSGTNSLTGATMPDGIYKISVKAKDANGKDIDATTFTTGTVTAVDSQNGTTSLLLGKNLSVPFGDVKTVYSPGTNPGA
jgi:flagellar basal-body rod modification protein FlgD